MDLDRIAAGSRWVGSVRVPLVAALALALAVPAGLAAQSTVSASTAPTPTPAASVTPSPSTTAPPATIAPTPVGVSVTPSPTSSASVTPTATVTPTASVTPTVTPSVAPSGSVTPTVTPTGSVTPTVTPTGSVTPTPTPTGSVTPTPSPTPTPTAPRARISVSGPLTRSAVPFSYRPGCPVRPSELRRMQVTYWDFAGKVRRGLLIVRRDAVADMTHVFTKAFEEEFRIMRMRPIEYYYNKGKRSPTASDKAAMRAGNTSAFNCRPVVGNPTKRSAHSYGIAIDINSFQNPYVVGRVFYPEGARAYLRRTPCRMGMICPGGVIATAMRESGWAWGARWSRPDYQHFSANGR